MAKNSTGQQKFNIAKLILIFGIVAISVLGLGAILAVIAVKFLKIPDDGTLYMSIKDILTLLLPIISAWVGTVIAFYFSKDNFESAAKNTSSLVHQLSSKEKLAAIKAKEVMININEASVYKMPHDYDESKCLIKKDLIDGVLNKFNRNRLPILSEDNIGKYIIHRSFFDKFIVSKMAEKSDAENTGVPNVKIEDLTLKEMLDYKGFEKIRTESFFVIAEDDPLSKAQTYINEFEFCLDIFVTKDGNKDSAVTGWITNIIVENESKV